MKRNTVAFILVLSILLIWVIFLRATDDDYPRPTPAPAPSPSETMEAGLSEETPAPMATPTPAPSPTPTPEPEYFVISMVGDCTLSATQNLKGNAFTFEAVVQDDLAYPFAATRDYFAEDYLSIANMEGTFTTAEESNGELFTFKADPSYAGIFAEGSIEFVTLANDHSGDYLEQGLEDTKAALDAAGVSYAVDGGAYLYAREGGVNIGIYAKLFPSVEDVETGVARLQDAGADLIVAALHWGEEGSYRLTADQEEVGHAAIDAGASVVYGCHPHVLQPVEEYGDGYIFYSLGNWTFGGNTNPRDRDTVIAQVTVRRDHDGTVAIEEVTYIPCKLSGSDGLNDYQPQPYDPDSEEYARALQKLDGSFDGADLDVDHSSEG